MTLTMSRLSCCLFLLFAVGTVSGADSPFSIVIDGGSTGSRLHIFEFVNKNSNVECVRRGSARANFPLSGFARLPNENRHVDAAAVADHLMPAFHYAAKAIPVSYHNSTRVLYAATAGMRLLAEDEQKAVYDAMYQGLMERHDFVFKGLRREDIATLSGDLEGFYGAVAANYLKGTINANLELNHMSTSGSKGIKSSPVGALDMGGSSTQIVFLPKKLSSVEQSCANADADTCADMSLNQPERLDGRDFFATSYLSYGVDQFRERLWNTWIEDHRRSEAEEGSCGSGLLENPCSFTGYEMQWEGYTLIGTGDAKECIRQVQRLIPHPENDVAEGLGTHVGGVSHPPVQGKFFAMSLYFFTLDSLRELSTNNKRAYDALNLSWPNPSIQELYDALDGLCSRQWKGDLEDIQHSAHAFTRADVLPHRCMESVYMVTLLKDGFGFSPESRDITFTFLVDGSEVEWSLGMVLSLRLDELQEQQEFDEPSDYEVNNRTATWQESENDKQESENDEDQVCEWDLSKVGGEKLQSVALVSPSFRCKS